MQCALNPIQIPWSHHGVVIVEDSQTTPYHKSQSLLRDQLILHHQSYPVPHHIFHYQIEEGGRYESALSIPLSWFEVQAVIPVFDGGDLLQLPKHFQ